MDVRARDNVKESGPPDAQPMLFAHGVGCDQSMWRHVATAYDRDHRVITFDHAGAGGSDPSLWDAQRYATLDGYGDDVVRVGPELDLHDVIFVGHSVSAMIGVLVQVRVPERFPHLVMFGSSPRYSNDEGYHGGFSRTDIV